MGNIRPEPCPSSKRKRNTSIGCGCSHRSPEGVALPMTARYRHLTIDDRVEIQGLHDNGVRNAEIARRVGVHRSTIGRELRRGSWQPEHDHANLRPYLRNRLDTRGPHERLYLSGQAQLHADTRAVRSHQPYRMRYDRLVHWVLTHLRKGWTPEEISGRLPIVICPTASVSTVLGRVPLRIFPSSRPGVARCLA